MTTATALRRKETQGQRNRWVALVAVARDSYDGNVIGPERKGAAWTLLRGTSWQTLSQILPLVINLAMTPWIITGLGPARYSIFLLVTGVTTMLSQFDGGIGPSAMRFFTIYASRDDRTSTTRLLVSVAAVIFAISAVATSVAILFGTEILGFFKVDAAFLEEATFLFRVLVAIIAFILVRNLFNAVINSRQLFRFTSMALLAGYAVYIGGIVLTIQQGWGLHGVAATMVMQQIVGSLITVPVGLRYLARTSPWLMSRTEAAEFFRYAGRVQITGITTILTRQKDQLVAGWALSAQQSGPYGQGTNFAGQLNSMPLNATYPMQAMIGSEVTRLGSDGAVGKATKLQRVWVRAIVGWCTIGAVAAYFGVRAWLPDSFALTAPVASVLLIGAMFAMLKHVSNLWALTLGHSELEMRSGLFALLTNLLLSVVLGYFFGMGGVVAATACAQLAGMLFFSWQCRQHLPVRPRWFVREIPVVAVVLGVAVTLALELLADGYLPRGALGLLSAGLLAAPGMFVYAVVALRVEGIRETVAMLRGR